MWNIFLNLTSSPNVLPETRRKWQISPLQSFPTMTNGCTALNPTGRECCWATRPLWPDEAWLMKEWKSGCEGIQPQSHEEVNGTPAIAVWNTQAGGVSPILRHEKTEQTEEKVSLWRVSQPRKLTSTPPLRFLRRSHVFVLCLYFSHHMMNYSVLQPYSKTTGNSLYVIQNNMQTGERENLSVPLCVCGLDFKTKRVCDTGWVTKTNPKGKKWQNQVKAIKNENPFSLFTGFLSHLCWCNRAVNWTVQIMSQLTMSQCAWLQANWGWGGRVGAELLMAVSKPQNERRNTNANVNEITKTSCRRSLVRCVRATWH